MQVVCLMPFIGGKYSQIDNSMFFAGRANDTTMKTSQTATANATTKIASRNEGWGFFATLRENLKLRESETADAFDHAVRFTAKRLDMNLDAARRFMDSRLGRHLADVCNAATPKRIEEVLGSLYGQWKRDVREFRRAAINTTDEDFYC